MKKEALIRCKAAVRRMTTTTILLGSWTCQTGAADGKGPQLTVGQKTVYDDDVISEDFLAEIPLRSPRKLLIFMIKKYIFRIKASKK